MAIIEEPLVKVIIRIVVNLEKNFIGTLIIKKIIIIAIIKLSVIVRQINLGLLKVIHKIVEVLATTDSSIAKAIIVIKDRKDDKEGFSWKKAATKQLVLVVLAPLKINKVNCNLALEQQQFIVKMLVTKLEIEFIIITSITFAITITETETIINYEMTNSNVKMIIDEKINFMVLKLLIVIVAIKEIVVIKCLGPHSNLNLVDFDLKNNQSLLGCFNLHSNFIHFPFYNNKNY